MIGYEFDDMSSDWQGSPVVHLTLALSLNKWSIMEWELLVHFESHSDIQNVFVCIEGRRKCEKRKSEFPLLA